MNRLVRLALLSVLILTPASVAFAESAIPKEFSPFLNNFRQWKITVETLVGELKSEMPYRVRLGTGKFRFDTGKFQGEILLPNRGWSIRGEEEPAVRLKYFRAMASVNSLIEQIIFDIRVVGETIRASDYNEPALEAERNIDDFTIFAEKLLTSSTLGQPEPAWLGTAVKVIGTLAAILGITAYIEDFLERDPSQDARDQVVAELQKLKFAEYDSIARKMRARP